MSTTTVYAATSDGYLTSKHAIYATARSGGTITVQTANYEHWIDQYLGGGLYELYATYLAFDTSFVDTDAISAVRMYAYPEATYGPVFGSPGPMEVYPYNWGGTLVIGHWIPGATVAGMTKLASIAAGSFTAGAYRQLTSEAAFAAAINKTGTTYLYVTFADFRLGTVPTTEDGYGMYTANKQGTYAPKLEIDHAPAAGGIGKLAWWLNAFKWNSDWEPRPDRLIVPKRGGLLLPEPAI